MSPKLKALPLAVAQLIAAGAFSGLTAAPALAQMGATPIERITVTGTPTFAAPIRKRPARCR